MKQGTKNKSKKLFMWIVYALMLAVTIASASAVNQTDLLNDLVTYYKLDETSGTTAVDSHGTNDGTANNARVFTSEIAGIINTGADLTQGDDSITISSPTGLPTGSSDRTINMWVNQNSNPSDSAFFQMRPDSTGQMIVLSNAKGATKTNIFSDGVNANNNINYNNALNLMPINEWVMFTLVIDGIRSYKVYINGVDATSSTEFDGVFGTDINTATITSMDIGRRTYGVTHYADSFIDEVGIWNRALNSTEVLALYDIQKDGYTNGTYNFSALNDEPIEPDPEYFTITAKDVKANTGLNTFSVNVTYNSTTTSYSTTNGSVVTNIEYVVDTADLVFYGLNSKYFEKNVSGVSTNSSYEVQIDTKFLVKVVDVNGDFVDEFNLTINDTNYVAGFDPVPTIKTYITTDGLVYLNETSGFWDFEFNKEDWFSAESINVEIITNEEHNVTGAHKSKLNTQWLPIIYEEGDEPVFSQECSPSYNITINTTLYDDCDLPIPLLSNTYEVEISVPDYLPRTYTINTEPLETYQLVAYLGDALLNITAKDIITGATINNFTGWVKGELTDYINNNQSFSTTTGLSQVLLLKGYNYTVLVDAENYALTGATTTIFVNDTYEAVEILLYKTNSVDIEFRDDKTKALINNVTFEMISNLISYNFTTTNGTLNLTFLVPEDYTFRYRADGYDEAFYQVKVQDRSYSTLTLYLINSTESSQVTLTVIDESARAVEGLVVKSLKYDQETNTYIIQDIRLTDFLGQAIFNVRKNEEFYRFIIEQDGVMIRMTNPSYITADTLTIQVITSDLIAGEYFSMLGITASITYNNLTGNFRAEYNDESALGSLYCLKVTRLGRTPVVMGEECSTSASGVLLFSQAFEENNIYEAELYLKVNPIQSIFKYVEDWTVPFDAGEMGLIIQILLTIFFAMTFMYNPSVGAIMTPVSILLGRIIGLNTLPWTLITPLIIVGIVIVYLMEK